MGGTSSARRLTFLPSPALRTLVNTLMEGRSYRSADPPRPTGAVSEKGCVRLTWSLTPHSPAARVTRRHRRPGGSATVPNGALVARIASSPSAPDSRGLGGQGLLLSRTMLSDHKSPYVGRFACDWHRLATTDPHAARGHA